jgi:DNA-binding transcriptional LysR family regulator
VSLVEHLEKLRHFYKLSQHRSINEAAEIMGLSQAGLSKSISALENILETPLFIRSNQGLTLTKEGDLVLCAAKAILMEAETVETQLRSLKAASIPKTLRIGMYDSIAVYFFSDLISYLNTIYRGLSIELTVDTSLNLANLIQSGAVDLAIGVNLEKKKKSGDEFFLLFEDDYSFYVSPKIESSFAKMPLIIHPRAADLSGVTVEEHLAAIISKHGAHRAFNFETIKTLTAQGLGIGVMPTQVAKPLMQQRQLVHVQVARTKLLFGRHNIGFLASRGLLRAYKEFANDLYRLGQRWAKL